MSNEPKQAEPRWDIAFVGDEGDPDRVRIFAIGLPGQKWGAIGMECRGEVCVKTGKAWIDLAREAPKLRDESVQLDKVDVDLPRLIAGLHQLSKSFVDGTQGRYSMRIPAEPYRDGDLVCGQGARMLHYFSEQFIRQSDEITRLRAALQVIAEGTICPELFPTVTNEDTLAFLTAQTTAIAALNPMEPS